MAYEGGDDVGNGGNGYLIRSEVNEYTCLHWGNFPNGSTQPIKNPGYTAISIHYYQNESMPMPVADTTYTACHDFNRYGEQDRFDYPRLNLIENVFSVFSSFDSRFDQMADSRLEIDQIIQKRMKDEYNINFNANLFIQPSIFLRQNYGYLLRPLKDTVLNLVYCPSTTTIALSPLVKVVTDYTGDTQGLYYAKLETQKLFTGMENEVYNVNSSLVLTETQLIKYGFYVKNGIKKRINLDSQIETETIYFYYPFSDHSDPLNSNGRKYGYVDFYDPRSSTKKVGCVFKSEK